MAASEADVAAVDVAEAAEGGGDVLEGGSGVPGRVRIEDRLDDDRGGAAQSLGAAADDLEVEPLGVDLDEHVRLEAQFRGETVQGLHPDRNRFVTRPFAGRGGGQRRQDVALPVDVQRLLGRRARQRQFEHPDGAALGRGPPFEPAAQPRNRLDAVDAGGGKEPPEAAGGPALVGADVDHRADVEVGEAQQLTPLLDVVGEVLQAEPLVEKAEERAGPGSRRHRRRS